MGSVFKRVRKTIKKVTKPISKVTKGIAKGIAKVAKSVMKGVAKLNKKLGPIGMIAMSFAMPYAMQGLGAGFNNLMTANSSNSFGGFLKAVSDIGGNMRTGWNAFKTGFGDKVSGITNGVKKMFGDMGKGNNIFSRVSNGAKELFKNIKEGMPKFRKGTVGTVEVGGQQMSSVQAQELINKGMIKPEALGKQVLGSAEGVFTQAGSTQADNFITDAINKTYESKINALTGNTKKYYNDVFNFAKDSGTLTNKGEIYNHVINSGGTQAQYMDFTDDIIGYTTDLTKTGDYTLGTARDRFIESQGGSPVYNFNGSKTFGKQSLEPNKFKNILKNKTSKKLITAVGDTLLKKSDMPEIPEFDLISTTGATSNNSSVAALTSSTNIKGSTGTDFFRKTYGDKAWEDLKNTVNHMNYTARV